MFSLCILEGSSSVFADIDIAMVEADADAVSVEGALWSSLSEGGRTEVGKREEGGNKNREEGRYGGKKSR